MNLIVLALVVGLAVFLFVKSATNKKLAQENITISADFLAKNKDSVGIVETTSGLQYQVLQKGDGHNHPCASSTVKVHYHGLLIDGTVFDSSVERGDPISFPLHQVIKGWTEGLQLMVVGDKFKFFIPPELGYGSNAVGKIPPSSLLIFEVELLEIQ
jgi:peptidylprolyl isomerase